MPFFVKGRELFMNLLWARQVEADLEEEVRAHLEMLVDENVRAGMTAKQVRNPLAVATLESPMIQSRLIVHFYSYGFGTQGSTPASERRVSPKVHCR